MAKYHLNKEGLPAVCKAHARPCPIGGDHFESKAEALEAAEALLQEEEELFPTHKKHSYHVDERGAAVMCPDEKSCKVKPFGVFKNVHNSDMDMIFGAAQAFRASIGAMNNSGENEPLDDEPPAQVPPAIDPVTQKARAARARANQAKPVKQNDPNRPSEGDQRVIDGVLHEWRVVRGDGCRTSLEYGWLKSKVDPADTPDPVEGEERTVNGRRIKWVKDSRTGVLTGKDVGADNKNKSDGFNGLASPRTYGSNSWAGGTSYRC